MSSKQKIFLSLFFITSFSNPTILANFEEKNSFSAEIGVSGSYYQYTEPHFPTKTGGEDPVNFRGAMIGFDYIGTYTTHDHWYIRGDLSFFFGELKYQNGRCGTHDNIPNWYIDSRMLFGKNFSFDNFILAPFLGIGYRYLLDDDHGRTDKGYHGCRRESNYAYLPVGLIYKLSLTDESQLITMLEFDYMYWGKQITHTSDVTPLNDDIINNQQFGYGARFEIKYQFKNWAIGPFITYWHINDSDRVMKNIIDEDGYGPRLCEEPQNYTLQTGLRISYRF
jgi:hypothetical protein